MEKWYFDKEKFIINTLNLPTNWEYIYQNGSMLLKVDQFGPVYAQAEPPGDIMLFKREQMQKYSNWLVWVSSSELSRPFNNFFRPYADMQNPAAEPENAEIIFSPESAVYSYQNEGLHIETTLFMPESGRHIVMKVKIKNLRDKGIRLTLKPMLTPYCNKAQLAPWDKYEWYLKSGVAADEKAVFWSQLLSIDGNVKNRRTVTLTSDKVNLKAAEISLEKFVQNGSSYCPELAMSGDLRIKQFGDFGSEDNIIYGYSPVYASQYEWELAPGEQKELTQVLSMPQMDEKGSLPSKEELQQCEKFFVNFDEEQMKAKEFFAGLFRKNNIKTNDKEFDNYINYWLPLQMYWVAALDRGWPTGMRGSRDSAQDYAALLYLDAKRCKDIILTMFSCQRTDGWFPRQYSAQGRGGNHDLRGHVDGGVFMAEYVWMYLAHTQDFELLNTQLPWLDSDEESSILEHYIRCVEFYIQQENLGIHGLCKIGEGDWLDAVNRAGTLGKGESVMVSCQEVMALYYLSDIFKHIGKMEDKIPFYMNKAKELCKNIHKAAKNKCGYYNSVYNDEGRWIFSDCDPDGEERPYGPVNWYAVISKVAGEEEYPEILKVLEKLKCENGYRLFYPPLGAKPFNHVGRLASGDMPPLLGENGTVYNHGAQGFLARALSVMGEGDLLLDVLKWIAPYDQDRHPTQKAMTPPYAIVNCWQGIPLFEGRGLMCFLTGSVAMLMRGVYEWLLGIFPTLDGLAVHPCLPSALEEISCVTDYMGYPIEIRAKYAKKYKVLCNDVEVEEKEILNRGKMHVIPLDKLKNDNNLIEIVSAERK